MKHANGGSAIGAGGRNGRNGKSLHFVLINYMRYWRNYDDNNSIIALKRKVPEISMHYLEFIFEMRPALHCSHMSKCVCMWERSSVCIEKCFVYVCWLWLFLVHKIIVVIVICIRHRQWLWILIVWKMPCNIVNTFEHSREFVVLIYSR